MGRLDKVTGKAVLLLTAAAFALSFEKLHHVAVLAGYPSRLAILYPLIVEGCTTLCTVAAFLRHGKPGAWYPWAVGLVAFGYSLWVNSTPDSVPSGIVRAVPVACIPLMLHMWVIVRGLADKAQQGTPEPVVPGVAEQRPEPVVLSEAATRFMELADAAKTPAKRQQWLTAAANA